MRLLFTVVHFFRGGAKGLRPYGSVGRDPGARVRALTSCISSLHQQFGGGQFSLDHGSRSAIPANSALRHTLDIVVCTTGDTHLLQELSLPPSAYEHRSTSADPTLLGYECHAVLRERLGAYDYYCYLEDDLILHDPLFFLKLDWFNGVTAPEDLLQPNRYEVSYPGAVNKVYVDGELPLRSTASFQNIQDRPRLAARMLSQPVVFRRTLNPHSGAFFLNAGQLTSWAAKPYFMDRSASFIGPPESAATLGIMKAFRVYKPALRNAAFLELEHSGTSYLSLVGKKVALADGLPDAAKGTGLPSAVTKPAAPPDLAAEIVDGLRQFDP